MTNKEIAERLREIATARAFTMENRQAVEDIADTLDPPRPEPGTVVWWNYDRAKHDLEWKIGIVTDDGLLIVAADGDKHFLHHTITKPARILAPDEVAVKVPPVSEWPEWAQDIEWRYGGEVGCTLHRPIITRDEAERMEAKR